MRSLIAVSFLALALGASGAPAADAKSRALYKQAQQTYDRGDLEPALALFLQAYEATPLPGFLFNIAQCHRQLNNFERASFYFKRYLELAPNTPNATIVRALIAEVDGKQAEKEQQLRDEAGAARAREVELARVAAAKAETEAAAQRQTEREANQAAAAQRQTEREANQAAELALARSLTQPPPPEPPPESRSIVTRWYFWVGVAGVAAGAATATGAWVATTPRPRPATLGTDSAR